MANQVISADIDVGCYTPLNMNVGAFKRYLDKLLENIGADDETGNITIEYESDLYDSGGYINACVWRHESGAEAEERERREAVQEAARRKEQERWAELRERETLQHLLSKYGAGD